MSFCWASGIRQRKFTPADVAKITGVSAERQRSISSRYLDFRAAPATDGKRKLWRWRGVQGLMMFTEIVSDLGDAGTALKACVGDMVEELEFDFRNHPDGDFLIAIPFGNEAGATAGFTTAQAFARQFQWGDTSHRPSRTYLYNVSDMQRRLSDKIGLPGAIEEDG